MNFNKGSMQSNLDCFLHCTTPVVQSNFLLKTEMGNLNRLWHPWEREKVEYFTLDDLWNSYGEWSAYGTGVPIISNDSGTLVQYYVPYLLAIQIFTGNSTVNRFRKSQIPASARRGIGRVINLARRAKARSYGDATEAHRKMDD